ncbi:MAG: diguanylate cyclase, partial [Pseudomonadota bacterium]|nr:diguanylate cyclase [Pseudomonadota bacterium]
MRGVGETQRVGGDAASAIQHSLFILSPGDRDGLSQAAQAIGWRAIGARRPRDAPQRFLRSEAQIALIDLRRGGDPDALLAPLVPAMEAGGGALILLLDDAEEARVPALLAAGATHYLLAPFTPDGLRAVLASAQRLVERLGGEQGARQRAQRIRRGDALYWQLGSDGLL